MVAPDPAQTRESHACLDRIERRVVAFRPSGVAASVTTGLRTIAESGLVLFCGTGCSQTTPALNGDFRSMMTNVPEPTMRCEERKGTVDSATLREHMRRLYWIGGGSCAGKSTIARRIAAQHNLHLYATDDVMAEHARRSTPADCPLLHQFLAMDMDDRWVNRSPTAMLNTFHWFHGEAFNMIIEDLLRIPTDVRVLVEGFRLLPHLVKPILSAADHAVWLLPSPEFRLAALDRRGGWTTGFLAKTSNPTRALQNLLERDRMFTDRISKEVEDLKLRSIRIDAAVADEDSANLVAKIFGL